MTLARALRSPSMIPLAVLLSLTTSRAAMAQPASAAPARVLVQAGSLIDGRSDTPRREVTIVVEGERIVEIVSGYRAAAAGETVVDLRQLTVVPGLIDMHVHLGGQLSPTSYIERFTLNAADMALQAASHARITLRAGFTTVRNLGDSYNVTIALRDAIRKGWVEGPRIYTAGKSLATTGGHADPTNGFAAALASDPGPAEGVLNGPEDARKAVRQRYKDGADLIKLTATGGVLSLARNPDNPQFTDDELQAVVATARDYGFAVAVHAHGAEGMKRAIRAGVDSIEHGTRLDDEAVKLMLEHGTYLVATLSRGPLHGRDGQGAGMVSRSSAAEGGRDRSRRGAGLRAGVQGGRQDRLRHRHRRLASRRQRQGVRLHGRGGHAADEGDPGRDARGRPAAARRERSGLGREGQARRPRRREARSARRHRGAFGRGLRDEGRSDRKAALKYTRYPSIPCFS